MMDFVRWKSDRHELGYIEHIAYDTITSKEIGRVHKVKTSKFQAYVTGRPIFHRTSLLSAKNDVQYMYEKLGVGNVC